MKNFKKLREKMKENKGFTLIEMIIVIAIIAILIALIAPNLQKFLRSAKQTKADAAAKTLYTATSTYLVDQYTQGTPVTPKNATWTDKSTEVAPIMKDYFNENEIKRQTSFTIEFDANGDVAKVTWTEDGFTGIYPKKDKAPEGGGSGN